MLSISTKSCVFSSSIAFVRFRSARSAAKTPAPPKKTEKDDLEYDVINALTEAEKICGKSLSYPKLVSIGNQSSGKSSVMEAITGVELFPKGQSMVTKRPLHLTLRRVETGTWAEFEDGSKLYDMPEITKRIERENKLTGDSVISSTPLYVKICSPDVYNLSVTDLPGYISVVKHGEDRTLPKKIRELCKPFVQDENTIPLVVTSATEDPANCKGLQEVYKQNAQERSFGVVTKLDLPTSLDMTRELLKNTMYPLGFGFFGVVLRSGSAVKQGVTIDDQLEKERKFFEAQGLLKEDLNLGVQQLRKTLSDTLLTMIAPQLPSVIKELDSIIAKLEGSQHFLAQLAEETDLDTISKDLAAIVKKLHSESSYRSSFEKGFRDSLRSQIRVVVDAEFLSKFPILMQSDSERAPEEDDPLQPRVDEVGDERMSLTKKFGKALGERYRSFRDFSKESAFDVDRLRRVFIFGENAPEKVSDRIIHNLKDQHTEMSALLSFFVFKMRDDKNFSRMEWVECLERAINGLIDPKSPSNLQNMSFELIMSDLNTFINSIQIDGSMSTKTELAREFGKYLFDKIGRQIYGRDLSSAIYHHLNTEKRPDPDFSSMAYYLSQQLQHPTRFESYFFGTERKDVEIFGREWTQAYKEVLIDRITDNLFKSIGVNLLDPLIEEAIRYTLQTFRGDHMAEEAERQMSKIETLKLHRLTLQKCVDKFN